MLNFYQRIKSYLKAYEYIRKVTIGQRDYYKTGCLFDHTIFKENFKMFGPSKHLNNKHLMLILNLIQINFTSNLQSFS